MRVPSSLKLIAGMWIAALLGALAGRSLAEVSSTPSSHGGAAPWATDRVGVR